MNCRTSPKLMCHWLSLRIVGIAGLYRTGKSFLLNRLLGRLIALDSPVSNFHTRPILHSTAQEPPIMSFDLSLHRRPGRLNKPGLEC